MQAGIQFTNYVPTSLVGVNSPSPTLAAEAVTGLPISTGAFPGNCFYLTESQAYQLSQMPINGAAKLTCHAGWYMVVQVDAGATAANILAGAIGAQKAISTSLLTANQAVPVQAQVTDASNVLSLGQNPVVFLNAVTPGNYTIVQVSGDAHVLLAASQTTVVGSALLSTSAGTVDAGGSTALTAANIDTVVGIAEEIIITPAGPLTLTSVAASSAGVAVYQGTITGGGTNNYVGNSFVITGFVNPSNNGTFKVTANTTTSLTLANTAAIAETHAGTATPVNLVRVNLKFPFGQV